MGKKARKRSVGKGKAQSSVHPRRRLAILLAKVLNDHASVEFYDRILLRAKLGEICPGEDLETVYRMFFDKAHKLMRQRKPAGSIDNPAAVFTWWVKQLATRR